MAMPADLARKAHALFTRAMEEDDAARAAFVHAQTINDPALRERVLALLAASASADAFLDAPALGGGFNEPLAMPDAVGTYLVIGVLGSGGMATVYEAVQEQPKRRVALKVLHQSLLDSEAYARFRFETETLARLQHPGIAQIYESGTARLGHGAAVPFFAMELVVDATPITEFARRRGLSLRERIEMAALVCDAVHYGHQHGVIHRDIKPANVLVDHEGRARVIDFGIARAIEPHGGALTSAISGPSLMGTLNAMSPEQCTNATNVDVRTDVYSLGVLLYELVADRTPHDLSRDTLPTAINKITNEQPQPVSTHSPAARGDLDAIIAMAMAKERDRRYSTAADLAADLRRYLAHQSVIARHATAIERTLRFAKRNKPLAAALATSVMLLIGGVVVSSIFAYRAAIARDAALERERDLEIVTEFQESLLRDVNMQLLGDTLKASIKESIKRSALLESPDAVEDALRDWENSASRVNFTSVAIASFKESVLNRYAASIRTQFADRPILRARLLQRLAGTMNTLGFYAEAEPLLRDALEARIATLGKEHADSLQTMGVLSNVLSTLGRFDEAHALVSEAFEISHRVHGPDDRDTLRLGTTLGGVLRRMGKLDECERVWTDTMERLRRTVGDDDPSTLRLLNNMGVLYAVRGDNAKAEACWRELLERRKRLQGEDHADYRGSLGNLAVLLQDQGRLAEAKELFELELASVRRAQGDSSADALLSMGRLASLLEDLGDLQGAEALMRQCVDGRRAALGDNHIDTFRSSLLLGVLLGKRGHFDEARTLLQSTLATQTTLHGRDSAEASLASVALAHVLVRAGEREQSVVLAREALARADSSDRVHHEMLGQFLANLGQAMAEAGLVEDAKATLSKGYALLAQAIGPDHPRTRAAAAHIVAVLASHRGTRSISESDAEERLWRARADGTPPP